MTEREKQRADEMNPALNSLIPGSPASREAIAQMENEDTSRHGENVRGMRPESNPLITGADFSPNDDPHGIPTLDGAPPADYVWSEKSGLYFKGTELNGR